MRRLPRTVRFLLFFILLSFNSGALLRAQESAPPLRQLKLPAATSTPNGSAITPEDYGVQEVTYTIFPASDFRPFDSTTTYTTSLATGAVSRTGGGNGWFSHAIEIPPGAILVDITTYANDSNATANVTVSLGVSWRTSDTGLTPTLGYTATATSTGAPGDTAIVVPVNYTLPAVCGGNDYNWMVWVVLNTTDNTNSFNGVRLRWKRQISPDSSTATFTDVPVGHPFHRFVEALYAAGITGGCGGGNFCPDAPVTRGQMAVFLAGALGLHWAP